MESSNLTFKNLILVFLFLAFSIFLYQWVSSPLVITVSGAGEVIAKAENATVVFSVSGRGDNATNAMSDLKASVNRIKETLKSGGVQESAIYESLATTYPSSLVTAGSSGFLASTSMGFKTIEVNNLDNLTSTLYTLGATVVSQPILSVDNQDNLDQKAYDLALSDAKGKASKIGNKNLKFLRKIVLIQQSEGQGGTTVTSKPDTVTQVDNKIPADAGVIKIQKALSVSYKMW